ncbi:hypothetical protein HDU96_000402 [Phlyctochytrium bullatum]|nr:hypothetical protein HDU96_000402 [Phlyctochytrium bullatum]
MTRITIFGATGPTGRRFLDLVLQDPAFHVTCLCRNPNALSSVKDAHPNQVTLTKGDLMNFEDVKKTIHNDTDIVVFTAGVSNAKQAWKEKHSPEKTKIYSVGMKNVWESMRSVGVKRIIVISSASVEDSKTEPFMWRAVFKPLIFSEMYGDMAKMEHYLHEKAGEIDWTILRPTMLVDELENKPVQVLDDIPPQGFMQIPKLDRKLLAKVMFDEVKSNKYKGQIKVVTQ